MTRPGHATALAIVIAAVAAEYMVDPAQLDARSTAADVPGWDSISQTMLVMRLEDAFGRTLEPSLLHASGNLGELADAILAMP